MSYPLATRYKTSFVDDFFKEFYRYNRPFQEVEGYVIKHDEDGNSTVVINALGVDPADIDVSVSQDEANVQTLSVTGKTQNKLLDKDFSIEFYFKVRKPLKKITKSFNSGLLSLKIEYERPTQPDVEIIEA